MKKIKIIIITLLIAIIVLSFAILGINLTTNNKTQENNSTLTEQEEIYIDKVSNMLEFDNVSLSIKKYIRFLSIDLNNQMQYTEQELSEGLNDFALSQGVETYEDKKEAIYSFLDEEYIEENHITLSNLYNFVEDEYRLTTFTAIKIICRSDSSSITRYGIYGRIVTTDENGKNESKYVYYILTKDNLNTTFSIRPLNSEKINDINEINLETTIKEIKNTKFNSFSMAENLTDAEVAKMYFNLYMQDVQYDIERAYNTLNSDYKNKKFGSLKEYNNYIDNMIENLKTATIKKYSYTETDEYKQYICEDNNGNYYIFRDEGVMD